MTLPIHDTTVLYPAGTIENTATVLHVETLPDGRAAVLLDQTACHPVDAGWPDQGADRGALDAADGSTVIVDDCVVAATNGSALFIGADVPVRPGEDGWAFVVAHLVGEPAPIAEGDEVTVHVAGAYRRALSRGHTACHLASLALNAALADRWTKQPREDGLGNPDFDKEAIQSSRILESGSLDRFRLNKSLRRKGFTTDGLADELEQVTKDVNATLAEWIATGTPVRIDRDGDRLTDRRYWVAELAGATVRIPCGGTHATSLAELGDTRVELTVDGDGGTSILQMRTTASA